MGLVGPTNRPSFLVSARFDRFLTLRGKCFRFFPEIIRWVIQRWAWSLKSSLYVFYLSQGKLKITGISIMKRCNGLIHGKLFSTLRMLETIRHWMARIFRSIGSIDLLLFSPIFFGYSRLDSGNLDGQQDFPNLSMWLWQSLQLGQIQTWSLLKSRDRFHIQLRAHHFVATLLSGFS